MGTFHSADRKNGASPVSSNRGEARFASVNSSSKSCRAKPGSLIPMVHDGRLRKILQMIESRPSRTIHDLALECNLSPSHLQHLFKQRTGLGLGHLLTEQRMELAINFLAHTDLSIKEIASMVGYEHTSSFTRAFERHFQQPPSSYRQTQSSERVPSKNR